MRAQLENSSSTANPSCRMHRQHSVSLHRISVFCFLIFPFWFGFFLSHQ
jgi:hypothetical protein